LKNSTESKYISAIFCLHTFLISIISSFFIKTGACNFGFHGAFGVITNAFRVCGIIGQPRELLYQVDQAGVDTRIPSHSIFMLCFFVREISKDTIFQFPDLISISFTAIAFLISQFVSSSISSKGYFLSTKSVFGLIESFEFNKNHLCQKFIHKNGIFFS